jgi:hypothetical protein
MRFAPTATRVHLQAGTGTLCGATSAIAPVSTERFNKMGATCTGLAKLCPHCVLAQPAAS